MAVLDKIAHLHEVSVGALVEHRGKDLFLPSVRGDETRRIGLMNGDWLFEEEVEPSLEHLDSKSRVGIVGRRDKDGVHQPRIKKGGGVGEPGDFRGARELGDIHIAHGGEFQPADLAIEDVSCVMGAHAAGANDSKADRFHVEWRYGKRVLSASLKWTGEIQFRKRPAPRFPYS